MYNIFWPVHILTETCGLFLDKDPRKHDKVLCILKLWVHEQNLSRIFYDLNPTTLSHARRRNENGGRQQEQLVYGASMYFPSMKHCIPKPRKNRLFQEHKLRCSVQSSIPRKEQRTKFQTIVFCDLNSLGR